LFFFFHPLNIVELGKKKKKMVCVQEANLGKVARPKSCTAQIKRSIFFFK